jgi:menaquinone-dependent protoporphyrinogen oxidase
MNDVKKNLKGMRQRDFYLLLMSLICLSILHASIASASNDQLKPEFVEFSCKNGGKMNKNILIAYASKSGSTGGVAEAMGKVLCDMGVSVDVRLMENVKDLNDYHAIIVGSAIRKGRWLPEAVDFVKKQQDILSRKPCAYFVVCLTMKDDTPENRAKTLAYLDPVVKENSSVRPVSIGLFPGAVNFSKMSFASKTILKVMGTSEGDYRNWPAVKAWTANTGPMLLKVQP